ncbi:MAG: hypothetical protein WBX01_10710 [Nitrososphaeraceae archaeon]
MDKCLEIGADYVVNHRDADWRCNNLPFQLFIQVRYLNK